MKVAASFTTIAIGVVLVILTSPFAIEASSNDVKNESQRRTLNNSNNDLAVCARNPSSKWPHTFQPTIIHSLSAVRNEWDMFSCPSPQELRPIDVNEQKRNLRPQGVILNNIGCCSCPDVSCPISSHFVDSYCNCLPRLILGYPVVVATGRLTLFPWYRNITEGFKSIVDTLKDITDEEVLLASCSAAADSPTVCATEYKSQILPFMAAAGTSKVHVLALLDAGVGVRHMMTNLGMSTKMTTLTTVNTPHRGSMLFDEGQLGKFMNWWWNGYSAQSDDEGGKLKQYLMQLNPTNMAQFNAHTPDVSGVAYFSYGSKVEQGIAQNQAKHAPLLWKTSRLLADGVDLENDGISPIGSQKWGAWKGDVANDHTHSYATGLDAFQTSDEWCSGNDFFSFRDFLYYNTVPDISW